MVNPNFVEDGSLPSENGSLRRFSTDMERDIDEAQLSPLNTFVSTASDHGISPRVSTVGTDDEFAGSKTLAQAKEYVSQDFSAPGLDSLHWAGVKKKGDFDQRSIASSMNAEKDDKSVYEVPLAYEEELVGAASTLAVSGMRDSDQAIGMGSEMYIHESKSTDIGRQGEESRDSRAVSVRFDLDGGEVKVHMEDVMVSSQDMRRNTESVIAASSACTSSGTSPRSFTPASPEWDRSHAAGGFEENASIDDGIEQNQEDSSNVIVGDSAEVVEEISLQLPGDVVKANPSEEDIPGIEEQREEEQGDAEQGIPRVDMGPEWESVFKGLVYEEGIDALGRPVVVLDADAIPPRMRSSAVTYVRAHLHPIVSAGDYVIVFTAKKVSLPTFWIMGAYQALPRPFRKNVQYVILVRPSGFLRAILAFMRPFVSKKAGRKIKLVETLEEIGEATSGEVTMHHLGASFLEHDQKDS